MTYTEQLKAVQATANDPVYRAIETLMARAICTVTRREAAGEVSWTTDEGFRYLVADAMLQPAPPEDVDEVRRMFDERAQK